MNKDSINQFDEQATEKSSTSNVFNKRTLIIGALIGISAPVAFLLYFEYFPQASISDNNTQQTNSYQDVLAEHLKVGNLNSLTNTTKQSKPANKTKHSIPSNQANTTKQSKLASKTKHSDQTKQAKQTNQLKQTNKASKLATIDIKNTNKNTNKISALALKNTAYQNYQANDQHHNQASSYQISQKSNQKHSQETNQKHNQENTQAQIADLYKNPQSYFNNLLKTQRQHTDEIILKLDQSKENTKTTIGQLKHSMEILIAKISPLLNQQQTNRFKTKPLTLTNTNPNTSDNNNAFELIDISLWDQIPQATIRFAGKVSIVDVGSVRVGWKVLNIDFDKERITIVHEKNGQQVTLERIR